MKRVVFLALFGVLFFPARPGMAGPEKAGGSRSCMDTPRAQSELNFCAGAIARAADERLNKSYHAVLCYLDPDERIQLLSAQRAWVDFRDSDCAFWGGGGGSISPMNTALCRAGLSDDRAKELDGGPPNAPRDALVLCKDPSR